MQVIYIYIYIGKSDAAKDFRAESALGRFGFRRGIKHTTAPWLLNTADIDLAARRLKQICIPPHIDCNPQYLFSHPSRLKSHDWKQVSCYNIHAACVCMCKHVIKHNSEKYIHTIHIFQWLIVLYLFSFTGCNTRYIEILLTEHAGEKTRRNFDFFS